MRLKKARKTFAKMYMSNWYVYRIHVDEINFMTSTVGARRRARLINIDTWVENKLDSTG